MDLAEIAALEDATELPVYKKLPLAPVRGAGCHVYLADGTAYLDMYGGHAVALTGHSHPRVVAAIAEQAATLLFYSNAVRSEVRAKAAERLCKLSGLPGARVFLVNSGAEANESALKLARLATGRKVVVGLDGGFHGRTVATLSVCGLEKYRKTIGLEPVGARIAPFGDIAALAEAVREDTAAVILEPIQSMQGARMADAAYYRALRELCTARGAALIFDEIQTGLGRAGTPFFGQGVGVVPDMITLAKGLASGVPCAALVCGEPFVGKVKANEHGTTFGAGHLAMAAMAATLDVLTEGRLWENAAAREAQVRTELAGTPGLLEIRGKGLLLGFRLDRPATPIRDALLARRVIVGTAEDPHTLRIMPPLTIGAEETRAFTQALRACLAAAVSAPVAPVAAPAAPVAVTAAAS